MLGDGLRAYRELMLTSFALSLVLAPAVAVFDVESRAPRVSPALAEKLTGYLRAQLAVRGKQLLPTPALEHALSSAAARSHRACYDQSCQIEIGREIAAEKVLTTRIHNLEASCSIASMEVDLTRLLIDRAAVWTGDCDETSLADGLDAIAEELSTAVPTAQRQAAAVFRFRRQRALNAANAAALNDLLVASVVIGGQPVVPPETAFERLHEAQAASYESCYDAACQIELGRAIAATKSISPELIELGGACTLHLTSYDLMKGTSDFAVSVKSKCEVADLASKLRASCIELALRSERARCELLAGADPGFVTIDSKPYSTVFYGDKKIGETPLVRAKLPAGCLSLRLENREHGQSRTKQIHVASNKTLRYLFDLSVADAVPAPNKPPAEKPPAEKPPPSTREALLKRIRAIEDRDPAGARRLFLALVEALAFDNQEALEGITAQLETLERPR